MELFEIKNIRVVVKRGDITEEDCDAIVNPANSLMIMGGGVAGAIKKKGGSVIEKEARRYAPVPVGKAVLTSAGNLKARYVIHAPTMKKPAMRININNVMKAAKAVLDLACTHAIACIAFPALGAGVGGIPVEDSAAAIIEEIRNFDFSKCPSIREIRLIAWSEKDYERMIAAVKKLVQA